MPEALPLYLRLGGSLLAALTISAFAAPSVKSFAERLGAMDMPGEARRIHDRAVPRMGGLAIFLGFLTAVLLFCRPSGPLKGIFGASAVIALMGALDDRIELRASLKLSVQLLAAVLAWRAGARIELISVPFSSRYVSLGLLSLPVSLLWILGCTNAINLIDGLDGLAVGVSAISTLCMLVAAARVGEGEIAVCLAALAGAALGFLPYNRCPAKLFMGDVGSQLLGFLLSSLSILGMFKRHALLTFFVPLFALALPLGDTAFAFCRRLAQGKNPFHADRGHIHHRLLDRGMTQRQVVHLLYAVSALMGLLAIFTSRP